VTAKDEERPNGDAGASPSDLPRIDFATFVLSLSHSALMHLGDAPHPAGANAAPDLEMARQTIDLLHLIEEKTHGNLTGEEERMLSAALYDLRLRFVVVSTAK
jgi:hypothetical protein